MNETIIVHNVGKVPSHRPFCHLSVRHSNLHHAPHFMSYINNGRDTEVCEGVVCRLKSVTTFDMTIEY